MDHDLLRLPPKQARPCQSANLCQERVRTPATSTRLSTQVQRLLKGIPPIASMSPFAGKAHASP
jgi:hypothetical protein